jgi:predicted secreted Zn-dependent protease
VLIRKRNKSARISISKTKRLLTLVIKFEAKGCTARRYHANLQTTWRFPKVVPTAAESVSQQWKHFAIVAMKACLQSKKGCRLGAKF